MSMMKTSLDMFPKPLAVTVPAIGGLDQLTPKTEVNPGSLQDCMNYEVARESGYALSKGIMNFSGRSLRATNTYLKGTIQNAVGSPQIYAGGIYFVVNNTLGLVGKIKLYLKDGNDVYFQNIEGPIGQITSSLFRIVPDPDNGAVYFEVNNVSRSEYSSVENFITKFTAVNSNLAGGASEIPGTGPINVLFELNDKIYAARDLANGTGSQLYTTTDLENLGQDVAWEAVDMGFTLDYKEGRTRPYTLSESRFIEEGESNPVNVIDKLGTSVSSEIYTGASETLGAGFTNTIQENQIAWQTPTNVLDVSGGGSNNTSSRGFVALGSASVANEFKVTQALRVTGFNIGENQPPTAEIAGISVKLDYEHAHTSQFSEFDDEKYATMLSARLLNLGSTNNKADQTIRTAENGFFGSGNDRTVQTFGGNTDTWGATELTKETVFSQNFGIEFVFAHAKGSNLSSLYYGAFTKVYRIEISVFFENGTEEVYFYDPDAEADVATAKIAELTRLEGSFFSKNSAGVYSLYDVQNIANVISDLEVRTLPNGTGTLLAKTGGAAIKNLLPTSNQMFEADSFAKTIKANFFIDPAREAIYGATGAGPAFSFNGTYFHFIRAPIPLAVDKPRHIAEHEDHLVLGYNSGSVLVSAVGDPTNFSGLEGAAEFGFGDNLTDLMPLVGSSLGVMCKQSAHALVGNTIDNFTTQTISKTAGAIEYSSVIMGQPMYADFRGISTISATQQYGDFAAGRISQTISDLLQSRLQETCGFCANKEKLVCALPSRSNNQYRLHFADGLIVTLTLFGTNDQVPVFTLQNYGWDSLTPTELNNAYVPTAAISTVLSNGQEVSLIGTALGKVFILDQGTGIITGSGIEDYDAFITFNPFNGGEAHSNLKYNEILIHGKSSGKQELICSSGVNYLVPEPDTTKDTISMGHDGFGFNFPQIPQRRSTHLPNVTAGFSLRIDSVANGNLPHNIQALTFRPTPLGDQAVGQKRAGPSAQM